MGKSKKQETHIINRDVRWWKNKAMAEGRELDKVKRELAEYKRHVEKLDKKIKKLKKVKKEFKRMDKDGIWVELKDYLIVKSVL